MTDSLGQSQVIAYLKRLTKYGFEFTIVSFEKPLAFLKDSEQVNSILRDQKIEWVPLQYTKWPPILSTIYDLLKGWKMIKKLYSNNEYKIVHSRGAHIASVLGLWSNRKYDSRFIFDMRGWWADEKIESGLWDNFIFKPVYQYFKRVERNCFAESNYTISLTYAGKTEIVKNRFKEESKVAVIPTCVDFEIFKTFSRDTRDAIRQQLNIPLNAVTLLYSGALGTNYNNEGIFKLYQILLQKHSDAYFLILSKDDVEYVKSELQRFNIPTEKVKVVNSPFMNVHEYLMAGDIGVILYRKQFSAIGRSPTKLGEYWACGLPVISIKGLGDLDEILNKYPLGGVLVDDIDDAQVTAAFDKILTDNVSKEILRNYAKDYFDIDSGVEKYNEVYQQVLSH